MEIQPSEGPPEAALSLLLLLVGAAFAGAAEPDSAARPLSPHAVMRNVGLGDVTWTHGFWAKEFERCRRDMLPAMEQIMVGTEPSQFLHNFRIAAGLEEGRHRGAAWNDGELYKWLEAAAAVHAVTKDRDLDRRMDEIIRVLARAQRADGYLHTPVLIKQRQGNPDARPFQDRLNFEMYNFGHLLTAACVHHRATGKRNLLDVAVKAADYLDAVFRHPTPELARHAVCPSHYMGMVDLYRTTRDAKYLRLAETFVNLRDLAEGGTDDNQDRIPFRKQTEAVGHAVRANYLYAGVADLYTETGDRTLLEPLLKIWENVVFQKMYVTGACGALYDGASPDGVRDQKQIARTHQAYGRNYQLPNLTAHNETCASIGNLLWNWRMLEITGEARYADVLERVLHNAILAGVGLDGRSFFYTNPLQRLDRMPTELRWSRTRQPFLSSFCCPPNVVRTLAEAGTYAYSRSEDAVWVHLYGGSVLDTSLREGERFCLQQETDYPWDGRVRLKVDACPARPVTLRLRIPGWAKGAALSVNGSAEQPSPEPGRYVALKRTWSVGDVVELILPLRPRLIEAHPLVEETRNQVAVQRGPLVYCLESCDLAKGVSITDVVLPRGIELRARHEAGLLGGVTVLEGEAETRMEPAWGKELYREWTPAPRRPVALKLIPYHVWGNRGPSEMTVWMPLGR
jgi:DUF1680 family protein